MAPYTDSSEAAEARAVALIEVGRFESARDLLRPLAGKGASAPTWCLLSQCDALLGDYLAALGAADRAVELEPESEWPHRLRATALIALGQHDQAVASAELAVRLDPHGWEPRVTLAFSYGAGSEGASRARQAALAAVALAPDVAQTHVTLGLAERASGDVKAAEQAYRRALEIDPGHALAQNNLGVLALRRGRLSSALDLFAGSTRADPSQQLGARNWLIAVHTLVDRLVRRLLGVTAIVIVVGLLQAEPEGYAVYTWTRSTAHGALRPVLAATLLILVAGWFVAKLRRLGGQSVRAVFRRQDAKLQSVLVALVLSLLVFAALMAPAASWPTALVAMAFSYVIWYVTNRRNSRLKRTLG